MKVLYKFVVWGDNVSLLSMYSKLREEMPVFFEMEKIDSLVNLKSFSSPEKSDFDFIYFEVNKFNFQYFVKELIQYKDVLRPWLKFFMITSSVDDSRRKFFSKLIRKLFGHYLIEIAYSEEYEQFSFEFVEFLLSLPKKKIILADGKLVEIDFLQRIISIVGSGKKCQLSNTESQLFRQLFLSWEENRKYVEERRLKNISRENSLPVLLSRLRKKLLILSEISNESFFSVKNNRKYGYFLEEE